MEAAAAVVAEVASRWYSAVVAVVAERPYLAVGEAHLHADNRRIPAKHLPGPSTAAQQDGVNMVAQQTNYIWGAPASSQRLRVDQEVAVVQTMGPGHNGGGDTFLVGLHTRAD